MIAEFDRWLAHNLPTKFMKDFYPRATRRLTEYGLITGQYTRETKHGFRMNVDRLDAIKWCVHYFGIWEPHVTAAFDAIIPPGGTVVDIGGNVGYSALLAGALTGPGGRVLTFEPCADTFRQLQKNIAANGFRHVEAHQVAVSDYCGTGVLHTAGANEQGLASLIERPETLGTERVTVTNFSEIAKMVDLARVDLLKIDVEGAEERVVASLAPFLSELSPTCAVMLEVAHDTDIGQVLQPFKTAGFETREISNQYNTAFYRSAGPIRLVEYDGSPRLADLVLSRDTALWARLEGATHQPSRTGATSCHW